MKPAPFRYHAPRTTEDAVRLLAELAPEDGRVLAGGQSLVPTMAFRLARPAHLIDINNIAALDRLAVADGALHIGACVRHAAFHSPVDDGPLGGLLSEVVRHIAHDPIRRRGTFCGSLAHADPASEWCCAAVALDAEMTATGAAGARRIAAREFFDGVMTTALAADELLSAVHIALPPADMRYGFAEFSRRAGDFAIAMALAGFRIEDGRIADARIAVGGAEPAARRIKDAEDAIAGRAPGAEAFAAAAAAAAEAVEPMEDARVPAGWRRELVRTLVRRALERAAR